MKFSTILGIGALSLSLVAGGAFAQDKAAKQAEVLKVTQTAMERFFKAKPELKASTQKAPGYAVFTTFGISFLVGGSGGHGVVHDNATKKNTFMKMGAGSVGFQIGAAESDVLIIFKTAAAMNDFANNGWNFGGGANVSAGADSKAAGGGRSGSVMGDAETFTLTKNGLTGDLLSIGSAKVWKDTDLN
jgi:lipid-binding SYLF domain-containing protein